MTIFLLILFCGSILLWMISAIAEYFTSNILLKIAFDRTKNISVYVTVFTVILFLVFGLLI